MIRKIIGWLILITVILYAGWELHKVGQLIIFFQAAAVIIILGAIICFALYLIIGEK